MSKLLNEGDHVEVISSNSGYKGPGELVSIAYGSTWLVKIEKEEKTTIITVKSQHINKISEGASKRLRKESAKRESEDDDFSEMTPRERKKMEKQIRKEKKKQAMKSRGV